MNGAEQGDATLKHFFPSFSCGGGEREAFDFSDDVFGSIKAMARVHTLLLLLPRTTRLAGFMQSDCEDSDDRPTNHLAEEVVEGGGCGGWRIWKPKPGGWGKGWGERGGALGNEEAPLDRISGL